MPTANATSQPALALANADQLIGLDSLGGWGQVDAQDLRKLNVLTKTADYTLLTADSGSLITNTGATGTVVISLPAATVGLHYRFQNRAAQALRIDPNGSEVIANNTVNSADGGAGKYIGTATTAVGASIHLVCLAAGRWDIFSSRGTWTLEA